MRRIHHHWSARAGVQCRGNNNSKICLLLVTIAVLLVLSISATVAHGFLIVVESTSQYNNHRLRVVDPRMLDTNSGWKRSSSPKRQTSSATMVLHVSDEEDSMVDEDEFGEDLDTGSILIDDLNWRVEKLRLE